MKLLVFGLEFFDPDVCPVGPFYQTSHKLPQRLQRQRIAMLGHGQAALRHERSEWWLPENRNARCHRICSSYTSGQLRRVRPSQAAAGFIAARWQPAWYLIVEKLVQFKSGARPSTTSAPGDRHRILGRDCGTPAAVAVSAQSGLKPITIESGPSNGSTCVATKPASRIQAWQSQPV